MDKKSRWSISFGTYPGVLFGARTYEGFVDIAIEIEH